MDNEDKVERRSAEKKQKRQKTGYVSAEIWWIASTPPTHPTQQAQKMHSSPSLWGRMQSSAYWMKQDQLEIYFQCKTLFFSEHSITEWLAVLQLKPVPQGQGKNWLEKKMQNQSELPPSPVCGVLWRWRMHRYLQYMKCVRVTRDVTSSRNQC